MDNLTHSLFGLTLARTPLERAGRGTTVTLLLASNAPDIDIVASFGGLANYLAWHRGPTHGPFGIAGLGLLAASIAWAIDRWRARKNPGTPSASLLWLWGVGCLGVLCHILMDLPTSYGTRPLSPFSWTWYAQDWMPIVDIYLLAILLMGLVLGRRTVNGRSLRQRGAYIALGLMLGNYGLRAWAHHQAIQLAPSAFGTRLPPPCDDAVPPGSWIEWWPRPASLSPRDRNAQRCLVELAAMPELGSPLQWRLIARLSNGYELKDVDLPSSAASTSLVSTRYPDQWTPAVVAAAGSRIASTFLGFSRFPAARSVAEPSGDVVVRFADMRFVMNRLGDQRPRTGGMFGATVRVTAAGTVVEERLGQ